jgi:hypothetical protein
MKNPSIYVSGFVLVVSISGCGQDEKSADVSSSAAATSSMTVYEKTLEMPYCDVADLQSNYDAKKRGVVEPGRTIFVKQVGEPFVCVKREKSEPTGVWHSTLGPRSVFVEADELDDKLVLSNPCEAQWLDPGGAEVLRFPTGTRFVNEEVGASYFCKDEKLVDESYRDGVKGLRTWEMSTEDAKPLEVNSMGLCSSFFVDSFSITLFSSGQLFYSISGRSEWLVNPAANKTDMQGSHFSSSGFVTPIMDDLYSTKSGTFSFAPVKFTYTGAYVSDARAPDVRRFEAVLSAGLVKDRLASVEVSPREGTICGSAIIPTTAVTSGR